MITRFQRHVRRRSARELTRGTKCKHLSVRFARLWVIPLTYDVAVCADDDAPDERVRKRLASRGSRERQRLAHVRLVARIGRRRRLARTA